MSVAELAAANNSPPFPPHGYDWDLSTVAIVVNRYQMKLWPMRVDWFVFERQLWL